MNEFNYNQSYNNSSIDAHSLKKTENALMRKVYFWMTDALIITGLMAYYVANNYEFLSFVFGNRMVFWGLIIAEFGLVIGLNAAINKISSLVATLMFILYAAINGVTMASIFMIYAIDSIYSTFFITAATFAVMAVYGSITKSDLTKIGNICLMALFGLIIAGIVNVFIGSSMMSLVVSCIGVLVFVGLTAYDAQKIKNLLCGVESNEETQKYAVIGALALYLDFVNLFLYLLRLFGRRK